MSPKMILNVDLSNFPSVKHFFIDFRKKEPVLNFRPQRFLYRGDLTGKLLRNRFLKFKFLVAGSTVPHILS